MTREEAKEFLPIIKAFSEGKVIETRTKPSVLNNPAIPNEWTEMKELEYWSNTEYRTKPETKYHPFKDAEECWQEMQKHQPFGWIKDKEDGHYTLITCVDDKVCLNAHNDWDMSGTMDNFTFADGQPFGIKEEKK